MKAEWKILAVAFAFALFDVLLIVGVLVYAAGRLAQGQNY
jgi:hypothetical protein